MYVCVCVVWDKEADSFLVSGLGETRIRRQTQELKSADTSASLDVAWGCPDARKPPKATVTDYLPDLGSCIVSGGQ